MLSNLINNAIKFTYEGGIVNVKLDAVDYQAKFRERTSQEIDEENEGDDGGGFVVTVKDNGPGIDPDIFSRLFIKFVSKSYRGTGLGLYISKSIIEAHGGKIWAENNVDGLKEEERSHLRSLFLIMGKVQFKNIHCQNRNS